MDIYNLMEMHGLLQMVVVAVYFIGIIIIFKE